MKITKNDAGDGLAFAIVFAVLALTIHQEKNGHQVVIMRHKPPRRQKR